MSTDRELLEMAAKAIGGSYDRLSTSITFNSGFNYKQWEPLDDDGDALRLAVNLELTIHWDSQEHISHVEFELATGETVTILEGNYEGCKATRRAIVRAAAEIGRSMP